MSTQQESKRLRLSTNDESKVSAGDPPEKKVKQRQHQQKYVYIVFSCTIPPLTSWMERVNTEVIGVFTTLRAANDAAIDEKAELVSFDLEESASETTEFCWQDDDCEETITRIWVEKQTRLGPAGTPPCNWGKRSPKNLIGGARTFVGPQPPTSCQQSSQLFSQ